MSQSAENFRGINLACGGKLCRAKGWINADHSPSTSEVRKVNLLKPFPFEEATFDVVYHSQFLEHLPMEMAVPFLKECRRILKPNGVLRVVTPDLAAQAEEYLKKLQLLLKEPGNKTIRLQYEWIRQEMLDQLTRQQAGGEMVGFLEKSGREIEGYLWERMGRAGRNLVPENYQLQEPAWKKVLRRLRDNGRKWMRQCMPQAWRVGKFRLSGEAHVCMYDEYLLSKVLEEAGFTGIKRVLPNESRIPDWNGTLLDCDEQGYPDGGVSLFMEASRPAL